MLQNTAWELISSDAVAIKSRQDCKTVLACATLGGRAEIDQRANLMELELEGGYDAKVPPPPRTAQKRSAFSLSLATTNCPSAVTMSTDSRLSQLSPCLRRRYP
jgi:hypothetical protein